FNKRITRRKVLLILDGFSLHYSAIEIVNNNNILKNTKIVFLPFNYTLVY
ncbi:hypothetical protein BU16DRAFT_464815, partial [Lophium mytilinum]